MTAFLTVLGSGVVLNVVTFAILAAAPLTMPTADFAQLSLVAAAVVFGATVADFGLATTCVRFFSARGDERSLGVLMSARGCVLLMSIVAGLCALALAQVWLALAIFGTGLINVWTAQRAWHQARNDFGALARANLAFAGCRIGLGLPAVLTGSWVLVALALFIVPPLAAMAFDRASTRHMFRPIRTSTAIETLRYAVPVYLSSVFYNAVVHLPQAFAALRLDDVGIGTLGIAATLVGPLGLLNVAARTVILPRLAASERSTFRMLWDVISGRPFLMALGLGTALGGGLLMWQGVERIYGHSFPGVGLVCVCLVGAYGLAIPIGLLNMEVHRQGVPMLEAGLNAGRLLVALPVMWALGTNVVWLAATGAAMILAGELVMAGALLWRLRRGRLERTPMG